MEIKYRYYIITPVHRPVKIQNNNKQSNNNSFENILKQKIKEKRNQK